MKFKAIMNSMKHSAITGVLTLIASLIIGFVVSSNTTSDFAFPITTALVLIFSKTILEAVLRMSNTATNNDRKFRKETILILDFFKVVAVVGTMVVVIYPSAGTGFLIADLFIIGLCTIVISLIFAIAGGWFVHLDAISEQDEDDVQSK